MLCIEIHKSLSSTVTRNIILLTREWCCTVCWPFLRKVLLVEDFVVEWPHVAPERLVEWRLVCVERKNGGASFTTSVAIVALKWSASDWWWRSHFCTWNTIFRTTEWAVVITSVGMRRT